jgi:hypothetical protein
MSLESIARDVWIADGPPVSFFGFPYPTRMGIIRLPSGALWVWSPVGIDDALAAEVDAVGEVRHLVEPNKIHHLALPQWKKRWPDARIYAPPGLAERIDAVDFDAKLGDEGQPEFEGVIDHVIVHGSFVMDEVLFLHRPSRTLFVGDLVQKHDPGAFSKWKAWVMKLDGMVGPDGSTPREWRATFLHRDAARAAIQKAIAWDPERMVIAHGEWVREGGADALRSSLSWLSLE